MDGATLTTRQKALALNLDATRYGTFAEKYYTDLPGGVIESAGRLFTRSVKWCLPWLPG